MARVLSQAVFYVGALGSNLASVAVKMSSHCLYKASFLNVTLVMRCKFTAAVNYINVQHKKVSFLSPLTRNTMQI